MDFNYYRHVGYTGAKWTESLFSPESMGAVQTVVHKKTGVWVPSETVKNVIDGVLVNFRPVNINPFTRLTMMPLENPYDDPWQNVLLQTADILVGQINADIGLREQSKKLTRWTGTMYGEDVNKEQLRHFAPIKVAQKRPAPFQFHMRY